MKFRSLILPLIGIFTIVCALLDVKWFMNHHKAKPFINMFGYNGARLFYTIIGTILTLIGFHFFLKAA